MIRKILNALSLAWFMVSDLVYIALGLYLTVYGFAWFFNQAMQSV